MTAMVLGMGWSHLRFGVRFWKIQYITLWPFLAAPCLLARYNRHIDKRQKNEAGNTALPDQPHDREASREEARRRLSNRMSQSRARTQATGRAGAGEKRSLGPGEIARGLLETYGLAFIGAVVVAAVFVVALVAGLASRSCAPSPTEAGQDAPALQQSEAAPGSEAQPQEPSSPQVQSASAASSPAPTQAGGLVGSVARIASTRAASEAESVEEGLALILEDDLVSALLGKAKGSPEVRWVAAHADDYAVDGWAVQHKILKLAAEEEAASAYVRNWPAKYPASDQDLADKDALHAKTTGQQDVPALFQWDPRWGYTVYSSTAFGMTGCCPTALAMVYQGITGNDDMTPYDMGLLAQADGYMSLYEGTDANFLINEAPGLGLACYQIADDAASLVAAVEDGQVLIVNVGPGDFTDDGHFIVVSGIEDGKLVVNDPYSLVRSERRWGPEEIVAQSKLALGYTKAE